MTSLRQVNDPNLMGRVVAANQGIRDIRDTVGNLGSRVRVCAVGKQQHVLDKGDANAAWLFLNDLSDWHHAYLSRVPVPA